MQEADIDALNASAGLLFDSDAQWSQSHKPRWLEPPSVSTTLAGCAGVFAARLLCAPNALAEEC